MKNFWPILVPLLAVVGWLAWLAARDKAEPPASPALTTTDARDVFKKAFWWRPVADDEILHAVRHEWGDEGGLLRGQWFLVVKAWPGLIQYLRADTALGRMPSTFSSVIPGASAWFRFDPEKVARLQSPLTALQLIFSNHDSTLHATASGRGFTRGAPEFMPAVQGTLSLGRIPTSPPPRSK